MWEIQLDYGILITGHRKTIKNWDQPQQSSTKKDTEQNIQFGALCRGGKKIFLFRYLELSRVFISAGVQHPQLLMLCTRARFRASFSFLFWVFVHIFKFVYCNILLSIPFSLLFQAYQVKNIFFRFWVFFLLDWGFSYRSDMLRSLLVPWVCIPVLCCVWEWTAGWCQGDFCSPAITIISQPITGLWVSSPRLARRLHCPSFSPWCWPMHNYTQWSDTKRKPCVSRDNYCLLLPSLRGFSAGLSSVYLDFSSKLNQISSEAFLKNFFKVIYLPFYHSILIHTKVYTLIPFRTSAFWWHQGTKVLSFHENANWSCFSYITHSLLMRLLLLYCSPRMLEYFDCSPKYAGDYSLLFMEKAGGHSRI